MTATAEKPYLLTVTTNDDHKEFRYDWATDAIRNARDWASERDDVTAYVTGPDGADIDWRENAPLVVYDKYRVEATFPGPLAHALDLFKAELAAHPERDVSGEIRIDDAGAYSRITIHYGFTLSQRRPRPPFGQVPDLDSLD